MIFSKKATQTIAKKPGDHILVDLKLDPRLQPVPASEYAEKSEHQPQCSSHRLAGWLGEESENSVAIGSAPERVFFRHGDFGLFGCIFEAWKNHWILRTRPEDWWLSVACRIAKAIDERAKEEGRSFDREQTGPPTVRNLFVAHEGQENIAVELPIFTIYEANYDHLFHSFSSELESRIKIPGYAQAMQCDFSTSGSAHTIASQINLMASMQEFFTFEMMLCGCGLRGLEMAGSVADWEHLLVKLKQVRDILKPIQRDIGLHDEWWDSTSEVFGNLAMTRKTPEDPKVAKFWINIIMDTTEHAWVGGGNSLPGKRVEVEAYDGWLIPLLTGREKINVNDLGGGRRNTTVMEELRGWNKVPMKVTMTYYKPPVSDMATLIAGIVGFELHKGGGSGEEDGDAECVPSVEPHHMWAMLLPHSSPVRGSQPKPTNEAESDDTSLFVYDWR